VTIRACIFLFFLGANAVGSHRVCGAAWPRLAGSLLSPRVHFGAAAGAAGGGAGVLGFTAGRFLPLAGAVGSSCA
jgi:hypothetical protein